MIALAFDLRHHLLARIFHQLEFDARTAILRFDRFVVFVRVVADDFAIERPVAAHIDAVLIEEIQGFARFQSQPNRVVATLSFGHETRCALVILFVSVQPGGGIRPATQHRPHMPVDAVEFELRSGPRPFAEAESSTRCIDGFAAHDQRGFQVV